MRGRQVEEFDPDAPETLGDGDDSLRIGDKLWHPQHNEGIITDIDFDNARGKPFRVEFEYTSHNYNENSLSKLVKLGHDDSYSKVVMAYIVMAEYSHGLYSYGLYSYGLYSYGPYTQLQREVIVEACQTWPR